MESELLRCPFCDGEGLPRKALRDGYIGDWENDPDAYAYFIICRACACQGGWAKSEGGAIKLWNLRVVTLSPTSPEPKLRGGQEEPDYEAIVKEIEEYMCKEEYRLRMEGYAMISGASRGENFLRELKAKHTPVSRETDVREKPEVKDDSNK